MKMNTNSNTYTIIYSIVLVLIVAFLLAFVSQALKSRQDANVKLDQKKQILYSLNIRGLNDNDAEKKFAEVVQGKNTGEQTGENEETLIEADPTDGKAGVYVCQIDGKPIYVVPLKGMGLWGGIGGYLSYDPATMTVYGAYFNHESETAGLGAEIKDSQKWQEKFQGKKILKEGVDGIALGVVKKVDDQETQVEAISGATLTSNGVNDMLKKCLAEYIKVQTANAEDTVTAKPVKE